jgi:uncharacterized protein YaiL (DUF2058 family)
MSHYDSPMQNLRDKLLKAGAVSKKQARKARTETRQTRKKGRKGQEQADQLAQQRRDAYAAEQAKQAKEARERADEQKREQEHRALNAHLRQLTERHSLPRHTGQDAPFHFIGPTGFIRRFHTRFEILDELISGALGVVSLPGDVPRDYRVVRAEGLSRLAELAPHRILFWNQPGGPPDEPAFGARGPKAASGDPA